jgi:hypothetical protein
MKKQRFSSALSCALLVPAVAVVGCTDDLGVARNGGGGDGGTSSFVQQGSDDGGVSVADTGSPSPSQDATAGIFDATPGPDGTTGTLEAGPSGDAAVQVDTCPVSVLQVLSTVSASASILDGKWIACDGLQNLTATWAPSDTVGIEFTTATEGGGSCAAWGQADSGDPCMGGLIYFLVQGPTGLERGQTNAYQDFYALFDDSGVSLALNQSPTNGSWTTSISYSPSPLEFDVETVGYQGGVRLVRPPGDGG